jgi:hypothetical protein
VGDAELGQRTADLGQLRLVDLAAVLGCDEVMPAPASPVSRCFSYCLKPRHYLPRPVSATDLEVMRRLDRLHLGFPFAGSRMLQGLLVAEGCKIGRLHVKTLMKRMEIEALYRRPRTTKPEPGHKIYPYLLRRMAIIRPNQVWAMDITYIPMARGFVY